MVDQPEHLYVEYNGPGTISSRGVIQQAHALFCCMAIPINLCDNGRLKFFDDAILGVQHDEVIAINQEPVEFFN